MAKHDYIIPITKSFFVSVLLLSFLLSLALNSFLFSGFIFIKMSSTTCTAPVINSTILSCTGRYIYVQNVPDQFNLGLIRECRNLSRWHNACQHVQNYGFGPLLTDTGDTLVPPDVWYGSDQFTLEVIFHNRMKQYDCLTDNPAEAAAIYIPYYAALDIGRNLWYQPISVRDALMNEMLQWLRSTPEWAVRGGRDHFIVVGRTTWDMRRKKNEDSDWGGKFMGVPETQNMTVLIVESTTRHSNEFGIPFPTYFHPSKMSDIIAWQEKVRHVTRPHLFSFTGARRKNHTAAAIRDQVINQCVGSPRCKLLECEDAVRNGTVKIEDVLLGYSAEQIEAMREVIINLIPTIVYNDPRYKIEGVRDAFDIAIDSVIEQTRKIRDESGW
ncbi:hypothetical protein LUZ61_017832 [Rhynchospora tenuis]|uniref:Exostosin GT47 domain-containing protein n=1 Tax=Rhynchospora tenuis TaxID=198213 RepID=A0AAD6ELD6_9POAL|nr:hypothetical protein LUZ61_017832 [Rhynchospora tenuis]